MDEHLKGVLDVAWAAFREYDLEPDYDDDIQAAACRQDCEQQGLPVPEWVVEHQQNTAPIPAGMGFGDYFDFRQAQDDLAGQVDYNPLPWGAWALHALEDVALSRVQAYEAYWEWVVDAGGTPEELADVEGAM